MRLRIVHVVPYYEQAWAYGGIPRLTTTMTRALARRGHHVTVCTTDVRDAHTRASSSGPNRHGIDVRMFANISNSVAYYLQFFTPLGLRRFMRRSVDRFDIAHIHACHNLPGVIAAYELSRAGVPYVVSPNGTALPIERRIVAKQVFAWTAGRSLLPRAARVVSVSQAEVRQLRAIGLADSSIVSIPNPIDDAEFDRRPDGADFRRRLQLGRAPIVLFLGKLTPRKGVDDLVRAFAAIGRSDVRLVVVGNDMGTGTGVDSLIRRLGLTTRVIRAGLLTGETRLDAMAAANVVVYPSRDEIFGLVPLEALLSGTPVVVCDDSGCGEVISATGGGLVVPPAEPTSLTAAMEAILADEERWRSRVTKASLVVRQRYGSDIVCDQLESLYHEVLDDTFDRSRMRA